jgi:GTPase Era involved in 16S rRNA processing
VESIAISGDFDIPWGLTLVDMPGLNDISQARELIANKTIRDCNLILLVSEGTRPMSTKSEQRILKKILAHKDASKVLLVLTYVYIL